jgi:hypothetical protein
MTDTSTKNADLEAAERWLRGVAKDDTGWAFVEGRAIVAELDRIRALVDALRESVDCAHRGHIRIYEVATGQKVDGVRLGETVRAVEEMRDRLAECDRRIAELTVSGQRPPLTANELYAVVKAWCGRHDTAYREWSDELFRWSLTNVAADAAEAQRNGLPVPQPQPEEWREADAFAIRNLFCGKCGNGEVVAMTMSRSEARCAAHDPRKAEAAKATTEPSECAGSRSTDGTPLMHVSRGAWERLCHERDELATARRQDQETIAGLREELAQANRNVELWKGAARTESERFRIAQAVAKPASHALHIGERDRNILRTWRPNAMSADSITFAACVRVLLGRSE